MQPKRKTILGGAMFVLALLAPSAAGAATASGPLKAGPNPNYFVDGNGRSVLLAGSHTWDDFQDEDLTASPAPFDFNAYTSFLVSHGQNVTILWKKDLPTFCGWGAGGGDWHAKQFPWLRTGGASGTQKASDGLPAFDLTKLDQTYFDRLLSRATQLDQNGIYAIVQLFDGLDLIENRCANDGYPFSQGNNVNGVDDGGGTGSMTMTAANAITDYQDAFVRKAVDTLDALPNVLWEISEEAPASSTWWQGHMIALLHSYEAGKPLKHPVGFPMLTNGSDTTLYDSNADWVAPIARISPTSSCGSGAPQCKVNVNDSDHSYFGMWNDSAQQNRNYIWKNVTSGNSVIFMDPYVVSWTNQSRNLCANPTNGVCTAPDTRWDNVRNNLGYAAQLASTRVDLTKMKASPGLSSTGYCLANTASSGAEYLVYAPNGGSFTVDLSAASRSVAVEWLDPATGKTILGTAVGGSRSTAFTSPFPNDAVLFLADAATVPAVPWALLVALAGLLGGSALLRLRGPDDRLFKA
jgi:hypothetical protein